MTQRIHLVAGARPNFMKVGPVFHALAATSWAEPVLVHTGQHSSPDMSDIFIRDLGLPQPHIHLGAAGHSHATQTASVLVAYEQACQQERPDWVVVVGDVNSTLGACLAAKKLDLPVAHLEAGLRSGDRTMPEELNRLAVDAIADVLWTPSEDADANLRHEGVAPARITRVGNVMIDAYCRLQPSIASAGMPGKLGVAGAPYGVATLHRPANVDTPEPLGRLVAQLVDLQRDLPVVFPVHPRTMERLERFGLRQQLVDAGIQILAPLGYIGFMSLVSGSAVVITDSGGVQEETTYLGIPCVTVRQATERPITVIQGTNQLVPAEGLATAARQASRTARRACVIPLWDGHAAARIAVDLRERAGA